MPQILEYYFMALIPLLVAVDIAGIIPIYIGLSLGMEKKSKRKITIDSLVTALLVSLVFAFLGRLIFRILGITIHDFMIAGGLVLLSLAMMDLIMEDKERRKPSSTMGVVPLGVPLITGPATLTTLLYSIDNYGIAITLCALVTVLSLVGLAFINASAISRIMGKGGTIAVSKLTNLLLVGIAVRMIREGIEKLIGQ